jgi:CheY-like chemotaxis protein
MSWLDVVTDSKKIMVVDDDPSVREILRLMLKDYNVLEAEDGEDALKKFMIERPRIVLMDISLPKIDGIEATKKIKEIEPETLIIGITAFEKGKTNEILNAGAREVLTKPLSKKKLLEIIESY